MISTLKKIEHSENGSEGDVVWIQQEAVTVAQARDDGFQQNIDSENGKVEGFKSLEVKLTEVACGWCWNVRVKAAGTVLTFLP